MNAFLNSTLSTLIVASLAVAIWAFTGWPGSGSDAFWFWGSVVTAVFMFLWGREMDAEPWR